MLISSDKSNKNENLRTSYTGIGNPSSSSIMIAKMREFA